MKAATFFFTVLGCFTGCGPGNSSAIRHLFETPAPVEFKVGYVGDQGVPPFALGGSAGSGWMNGETVPLHEVLCNNARALFPGKQCFYPEALSAMTPVNASHPPEGYYDDDIFAAARQIPGDESMLKVIFLDGKYAIPRDLPCADGNCHFGYTVKKPGSPNISAVFIPTIRQFVDNRFGGSTSGVGGNMFAYLVVTTIIHEALGHQLGLVDGETRAVTDHEDPNGPPHHCDNPKCIMHATGPGITWWDWSKNRKSAGIAGDLLFDNDCQTDIRRAITY